MEGLETKLAKLSYIDRYVLQSYTVGLLLITSVYYL